MKILITNYDNHIVSFLVDDNDKDILITAEAKNERVQLGDVFWARCENVVPGINGAFLNLGNARKGFYPFDRKGNDPVKAQEGVLCQVIKIPSGSKEPMMSKAINLTGHFVIFQPNTPGLRFSKKITDQTKKDDFRKMLQYIDLSVHGLIIRSACEVADLPLIMLEIANLRSAWENIEVRAADKNKAGLLYRTEPDYLQMIKDAEHSRISEIVTDVKTVYDKIRDCLDLSDPDLLPKLKYFSDRTVPLNVMYGIETRMSRALSRKVYLPSGAYITIEHTEAMTVVDINSAGVGANATALEVNLEAAWELARQLRLRNISGIIVADFINMTEQIKKDVLVGTLKECFAADPIDTQFISMTKLGLVEITRKKMRPPLYEQMNI